MEKRVSSMGAWVIGGICLIVGVFILLMFTANPYVVAGYDAGIFGVATGTTVADLAADKCRMACESSLHEDRRWYDSPGFPEGIKYKNCEELLNAKVGGDNSFPSRCGYCVNLPGTRSSCTVGHKSMEWCNRDPDCEWVKQ